MQNSDMEHIAIQYYKSPFGELIIGSYKEQLCMCDWRYRKMRQTIDQRIGKSLQAEFIVSPTPTIEATIKQIEAYSSGKLKQFDLPVLLVGTAFQKKVWNALLEIPFGMAISYLELSIRLGNKKAIRAVAAANGANAISIIIPCHRIIGSNGQLIGYAGGLNAKKKLLELENCLSQTPQLSLFDWHISDDKLILRSTLT